MRCKSILTLFNYKEGCLTLLDIKQPFFLVILRRSLGDEFQADRSRNSKPSRACSIDFPQKALVSRKRIYYNNLADIG
jgi:hypothetical protein